MLFVEISGNLGVQWQRKVRANSSVPYESFPSLDESCAAVDVVSGAGGEAVIDQVNDGGCDVLRASNTIDRQGSCFLVEC